MTKNVTVGFIRPIDPVSKFKPTHFSALENKISAAVRELSNDEFKFVSMV